jgi:hypothetical protein
MLKQISILLLICIFSLCTFAQTEQYNAPIKWERYKVSDKGGSVLFPKLPILIQNSNVCIEQETNRYAAYADGIVYGLNVTSRVKQTSPITCSPQRKFDENSFDDRLKEIKTQLKTTEETKFNQGDSTVIKIKSISESSTFWLINDFKSKRWFELWIVGTDVEKTEIKNFVESFEKEKNLQGIEIEKGANRTLGDEGLAETAVVIQGKTENETENGEVQNIRIVLKPYARYTDAARQSSVRGTVRLRVTFLASGGIGSIVPLNELPFGLTEQAIAAASKIVFIPAKRNGKNLSVAKLLEYSFSIY